MNFTEGGIEVLEVDGLPEDMGAQHGHALARQIRDLADERIDLICSTLSISTAVVESASKRCLGELEKRLPAVWTEVTAAAAAAGIEPWKQIPSGGYSDLIHCLESSGSPPVDQVLECTIVPALGDSGKILIAGTWDSHSSAQDGLAILRRRPTGAPVTLALTTAGWPAQQGITSNGIGFAIANLVPKQADARGVPYIAALPRAMRESTVGDFVSVLKRTRLMSGRYYAVTDGVSFVGLESDGCNSWVNQDLRPHTNHYVFGTAAACEGRPDILAESEPRRRKAEELRDCLKRISPKSLLGVLKSNVISKTGTGGEDRTCAAFVLDPAHGVLHYTDGPPSQSEARVAEVQ